MVCGLFYMLPVKWLSGGYTIQAFLKAVKSFLFVRSDMGHLWFLIALFWCFILFFPLYKYGYQKNNSIFPCLLMSALVYTLNAMIPIDFLGLQRGMQYLVWFALGFSFEHFKPVLKPIVNPNQPGVILLLGGEGVC
jgi:hypothetical protein